MYNTPTQALDQLGGPGPSGHYLAMDFARVAASMKAQLMQPNFGGVLELSSWQGMEQYVDASALAGELHEFEAKLDEFWKHGKSLYYEVQWSVYFAGIWNELVVSVACSATNRVGLAQRLHALLLHHQMPLAYVDGSTIDSSTASESHEQDPSSSVRRSARLSAASQASSSQAALEGSEKRSEGSEKRSKTTENGRACDFGASVPISPHGYKRILNPLLIGEMKTRDPSKTPLKAGLCGPSLFQLQSEMQHARASNAVAQKDLQQPFLALFMSPEAMLLQLMIPCQKTDVLAGMFPRKKNNPEVDGVFVPITLVALNQPPKPVDLKAFVAAMLCVQLRMADLLLGKLADGAGNGQLLPVKSLQSLALQKPIKNTLWVYAARGGDMSAAALGSGGDVCVKVYDYYHKSDNRWYSSLDLAAVRPDQRRQPPDSKLLLVLNAQAGLPWPMEVHHGGPDCAVLVYPYLIGSHKPKAWSQMLEVMGLLAKVHEAGYMHADILPQNIVFGETAEHVSSFIDWDMARYTNGAARPTYMLTYNHERFETVRHPGARAGLPMWQLHDCYSLACLIEGWFQSPVSEVHSAEVDGTAGAVDELQVFIQELKELPTLTTAFVAQAPTSARSVTGSLGLGVGATGSPKQQAPRH